MKEVWMSPGIPNVFDLFIDINNTLYLTIPGLNVVKAWFRMGKRNITKNINNTLNSPNGVFATFNGDIYIDNGMNGRIDIWTWNSTNKTAASNVNSTCTALFVDINSTIYCSMNNYHKVIATSLNNASHIWSTVAGIAGNGSGPSHLLFPSGIFFSINFYLYVADSGNDRVQRFEIGEVNGTTVVGNGTITLNHPTGVILDGDNNLYIVDQGNDRIIRSGPNGFQCIVGCSGSGSALNQLSAPIRLSFDIYGNIFVTNSGNYRVQMFTLIESCGEFN
jgi:hypothetical protein